ncbi:hypothetical protein RFI_36332, partial [Reticulomyxa filosa]
ETCWYYSSSIVVNMYAINCEIKFKGNIHIAVQLFISKDIIIHHKLNFSLSPIQWNIQIHHDIPILLQQFKDKIDSFLKKKK